MPFEHRLQEACGLGVALKGEDVALAIGGFVEHAWAGVGEALVVGADETHRAHIRLIERMVGDALQ
ncbi:hypothetical protein D3C78_1983920 [compost metagenome]